jgi:hypothetical protein
MLPFRTGKGFRLPLFASLGLLCHLLIFLSLSSLYVVFSVLSHGGDLHDPVQNTHPAFAIPPIAFLLSLACSYVLVNHFRLRPGPGEIGLSS